MNKNYFIQLILKPFLSYFQSYPPEILTAYKDATSDKFKDALKEPDLKLKTAYCECPNYDMVIPVLLKNGIDGVAEQCKLTPGIHFLISI